MSRKVYFGGHRESYGPFYGLIAQFRNLLDMREHCMFVGYCRVSSQDQDLTVQRERLAHCERLYADTGSGTTTARPQLQACLDFVREGDTLQVTRLDRLARSTFHLYQIADGLAKKGVHLHILDQALDTHTETGRLLFGILAVIAQFETELRAERQREGIAKAKRNKVHFGRGKALTPAQAEELCMLRAEGVTLPALMQRFQIGKTAIYRYLTHAPAVDVAEAAD